MYASRHRHFFPLGCSLGRDALQLHVSEQPRVGPAVSHGYAFTARIALKAPRPHGSRACRNSVHIACFAADLFSPRSNACVAACCVDGCWFITYARWPPCTGTPYNGGVPRLARLLAIGCDRKRVFASHDNSTRRRHRRSGSLVAHARRILAVARTVCVAVFARSVCV